SEDQATQFSLDSISNSLALAWTTSPLFLLADREYAQIPGKCALLQYWDYFSSCERPPAVEQAESEMWRYLFDVAKGQDPMTHLPSLLGKLRDLVCDGYHPWYRLASDGRALQGAPASPIATSSLTLIGDSPLTPYDPDSDIEILGCILSANALGPVLEPKRSPPPSPNIGTIRPREHSSSSTTPPPTAGVAPMASNASVPSPPSPHSSREIGNSSSPENPPFSDTAALSISITPIAAKASIPSTASNGKEYPLTGLKGVQEAAEADQPTVVTQAVPDEDMDAEPLPAGLRSNPLGAQHDDLDLVQFTSTATAPLDVHQLGPTSPGMDVDERLVPDLDACGHLLAILSQSVTARNDLELQPEGEASFHEPAATPGPAADPAGSDMDISGGEEGFDFDFESDEAEKEFESEVGVARKDSGARDKQKDSAGGNRQKESSEGETEKESSGEESDEEESERPNKN
ncbi:hypothetical protein H0H92_010585, partial [Tricholoma furcatifolium]